MAGLLIEDQITRRNEATESIFVDPAIGADRVPLVTADRPGGFLVYHPAIRKCPTFPIACGDQARQMIPCPPVVVKVCDQFAIGLDPLGRSIKSSIPPLIRSRFGFQRGSELKNWT
jgi:hypothetical protein